MQCKRWETCIQQQGVKDWASPIKIAVLLGDSFFFFKENFFCYRLDKRTEDLSEAISSVARDVTRVVVEIQDTKRQALLKHTRDALSAEVQIRKKWRQLIERLIHER